MFLGRKTSKGFPIILDFDLPQPIDESDAKIIFAEIKRGDRQNQTKLIEGFMRLAVYICSRYMHIHTAYQNRDDVVAVAFHALTEAVHRLQELPHDNFVAYIKTTINGRISDLIGTNHVVYVPRAQKRGEETPIEDLEILKDHDFSDIEDILIHLTAKERHIVLLLVQNYTQQEIAKMLGVSQQRVGQIQNGIKKKLEKQHEHVPSLR